MVGSTASEWRPRWRRITADWHARFPELQVWRSRWLLRRAGPVVQGVILDVTSGGDYRPTAHVHALTRSFPTISLTLATELPAANGAPMSMRPRFHGPEVVAEAAERLRATFPLPLGGTFTVDELAAAYRAEIDRRRWPAWPVSVNELEDLVLLPAVVGRTDLVEDGLRFAEAISADWPPGALGRWGRGDDWLEKLAASAQRRDELEAIVDDQIAVHELGKLPVVSLG